MSNQPTLTILAGSIDFPDINECFNWRSARLTVDCHEPGFFVELSYLLAERLNMSVKYINADLERLTYAESTLTDEDMAVQYLQNGTVDLIAAYFDSPFLFGREFEQTLPSYAKYIVSQTNSTLTDFFDFFTIYDPSVWIGIFACFILVMLIYFIICQIGSKLIIKESTSIGNFAWKLIRLQLNQVDSTGQKLLSSNFLLLIFALLQCGLVISMYNTLITTQAVQIVNAKPFRDNELLQVVKNRKYSLIFQTKLRWWYKDIMTTMESPFFEIREAIKNNKIVLADELGVEDAELENFVNNKVREGGWITIGSNEDIAVYRHEGFCSMVYYDTNFKPRPKSLLMRKNHPLLPKINNLLLEETINLKRLHYKYYNHARPPKCEQGKNRGPEALTITPFYGVITLFMSGSVLGIICLCAELLMYRRRK